MTLLELPRPRSRTIITGDIHGCLTELKTLLANLEFAPDDLLLTVGDFLDRGPDSWAAARFFRDTPNAYCTMGNHERRVAGVIRGTSQPAWSQLDTLGKQPLSEHVQWADWLQSLPSVIATPDVIITHARLDPGLALDEQDAFHTCAVGGFKVNIDLDDQGVPLWFRKTYFPQIVCMGHITYPRTELIPGRLYALDTGCCDAGQLSALVLPAGEIVTVQASCNYTQLSRAAWELGQYQDLADMPLRQVMRLQGKIQTWDPSPRRTEAETRITELLDSLDFDCHLAQVRPGLVRRHGPIPPPSRARGEYYRRLKSDQPNGLAGFLTRASLNETPVQLSQLVLYLTTETIAEVIAAIDKL